MPTRSYRESARTATPKCHLADDGEYAYRDPRGRELFTKQRYRHDPCYCGRGKSFMYYWEPPWYTSRIGPTARFQEKLWRKPPDADWYLYRLDKVYPAIARGRDEPIYWCEGEKDADALASQYVLATTHHQGAGRATIQQASWLARAKYVILVADLDDAGAYDVIQRNNLLSEAGFSGKLEIVRAAEGNDAADHVAAGYWSNELVPVDIDRLRKASRKFKASRKEWSDRGYR